MRKLDQRRCAHAMGWAVFSHPLSLQPGPAGDGQPQGHTQGPTPSLPLPDATSSGLSLDLALIGLQLPSC